MLFVQIVFLVQKFGHGQVIDGFRLLLEQTAQANRLTLIWRNQFQRHQIAHLVIQRHNDGEVTAFSGQHLCLDKAGAADLTVKTGNRIVCALLDREGNGILCQAAVGAALVGNLVVFPFQLLQMAGLDHFWDSGTNIKITQALVLIAQLVNLLNGNRIADPGHHKQNQNLYI